MRLKSILKKNITVKVIIDPGIRGLTLRGVCTIEITGGRGNYFRTRKVWPYIVRYTLYRRYTAIHYRPSKIEGWADWRIIRHILSSPDEKKHDFRYLPAPKGTQGDAKTAS